MSWSAKSRRWSARRGHGLAWEQLEARHSEIEVLVKRRLTVVKIGVLLERCGLVVPYRTLQ